MGSVVLWSSIPALVIITIGDFNDEVPRFSKRTFYMDFTLPALEGFFLIPYLLTKFHLKTFKFQFTLFQFNKV